MYFTNLPLSFNGFKILLIADLHNCNFGKNQEKLIKCILDETPDIVVLAGDIIDKHNNNIINIRHLLAGIFGYFPIYAIPGNHEYINEKMLPELINLYKEFDVVFLDGDTLLLNKGEHSVAISSAKLNYEPGKIYSLDQSPTPVFISEFNILLHHFGNEFDKISDEYDLILSGHIHGGIIRLFNKGLFNANIKNPFFPKYSKGIYKKESGSIMVLSAGLGSAILPRFNNPKEIVIITLWNNN